MAAAADSSRGASKEGVKSCIIATPKRDHPSACRAIASNTSCNKPKQLLTISVTGAGEHAPDWLDAGWVRALLGGRDSNSAYERFVAQGLGQASPWNDLKGQMWLGGAPFLKHMARLVQTKPAANVPRQQRQPSRPTAAQVTAKVLSAYGIKDKKVLQSRDYQEAFQAWAYLLRRAVNMPLQAVAECCKISPSRISKIQRALETSDPSAQLRRLLERCNVKN